MADVSVTNTFTNSTTADASQVNTNFTDIINGTKDGTKTYSIAALACAGAVTLSSTLAVTGASTLNAAVTLGNSSANDITFNGSIASSIPIKTTFSYDLGSATVGWKSFYLGSDDSAAKSVRLIAPTIGTSYTFTLPVSGGTSRYLLETNGSGVTSWVPVRRSPMDRHNYCLTTSVAGSALTITLNDAGNSALSATNPCDIVFRSGTAATGTAVTRTLTVSPTVVVSSGSKLGHVDNKSYYIYVYALDNGAGANATELAVSSTLFDTGSVQSTTAEGGAGAADAFGTMYSATARSNVPVRLLGRLTSTQGTAGTWAAVPTTTALESSLMGFESGTYTPVLNNGANTSSQTAYLTNYIRVGQMVTVSGRFDATVTASGSTLTVVGCTLPFCSTFGALEDACGGVFPDDSGGVSNSGHIQAAAGQNSVSFRWAAGANGVLGFYFHFTYRIL